MNNIKVWGAFLWGITHGLLIAGIILRYYTLKYSKKSKEEKNI